MPQYLSGYVFISYSRKDAVVMGRIVTFLRKQGIKVWVDNEQLIPGTPIWEEEIEKAIKGAPAIVAVLSPDAKDSEWVRREISLADQYRKRIFPVLVRGDQETSISLRLINRQFVDVRVDENQGFVSLETALSAYLRELMEQEEKAIKDAKKLEREKAKQLTAQKSADKSKLENRENEQVKLTNKKPVSEQITNGKSSNLGTANGTAVGQTSNQTLWVTIGWAIAGLGGGFIYSAFDNEMAGEVIGGAIGGAIGGFVTYLILQIDNLSFKQTTMIKFTLAWAIGGAIGWFIGWELTEAIGAGIGMAIFVMIGMLSTLKLKIVLSNWKYIAGVTLAWGICGSIGWILARGLIEGLYIDNSIAWGIGTAIGLGVSGYFMVWQLMKIKPD